MLQDTDGACSSHVPCQAACAILPRTCCEPPPPRRARAEQMARFSQRAAPAPVMVSMTALPSRCLLFALLAFLVACARPEPTALPTPTIPVTPDAAVSSRAATRETIS